MQCLRYGDLRALDARGQALVSRFAVEGHRVRLIVDDSSRGLSSPPLIQTVSQIVLLPSDGASSTGLGQSVAINGNTAVTGATTEGGATGAAYVFVLSNGNWSQQAKLTASDGVSGDQFRQFDFHRWRNGDSGSRSQQFRARSSLRVCALWIRVGPNRPSSQPPTERAATISAPP